MKRLKKKFFNQAKKTEFIVKESYSGTKSLQNIFADIFISECEENSKKTWTSEQKNDIIQVPTIPKYHVCSNANSVRKE